MHKVNEKNTNWEKKCEENPAKTKRCRTPASSAPSYYFVSMPSYHLMLKPATEIFLPSLTI